MSSPGADGRAVAVYVAADFARADDANEVARFLEANARVTVISRWHRQATPAEAAAAGRVGGPPEDVARAAAVRNLADIDESEVVIVMTTGMPARGGRHFETGYAFARGKSVVILGPVEHAFQHLASAVVTDASEITDHLLRRDHR